MANLIEGMLKRKTKDMSKKHHKKHLHRKKKKKPAAQPTDTIGKAKEAAKKLNPFSTVKNAYDKMVVRHMATIAAGFCHKNPKYLIFIADPKTDVFFMAYDEVHVASRLLDEQGKKMKVIKRALSFNADKRKNIQEVDHLLGTISGGLDSIRKTRKEHRQKKHKRIIKLPNQRKVKYASQIGNRPKGVSKEQWEKMLKKAQKRKQKKEEESIRREQKNIDKGRYNKSK